MANKKQRNHDQETAELEKAYRDMTGTHSKSGKAANRTTMIVTLCIIIVVLAIGIVLGALYLNKVNNLTILDNISVAGVDVGGMTTDQAVSAVTQAVGNAYATNDLTMTVFDSSVTIPAAYSGGTLNVEKAVKAARNYGQVGLPSRVKRERAIAAEEGYAVNLAPYMEINEDAIRQMLNELGEKYNTALSQSTYQVVGNVPTEADLAAGTADMKLVVTLGTAEYGLDPDALYAQILEAYSRRIFSIEGNCTLIQPDPIDLEGILNEHQILPTDAHLDPQTYEPVESKNGFGFDLAKAEEAIAQTPYGSEVTIPFEIIEPEITTQEFKDSMFKDTLSTYTAVSSSKSGRDVNLRLACEAINGLVINPGQSFSYNDTLGERTPEKGYKAAATYVGGDTVYTYGGGICQVSSTLYYCVLMADLEVLVRENHGYASSYIPLGMDATVSWGGPEFMFRNNSEHPIKIEASASGGKTTVTLKGVDDKDYYVEMKYEVTRTIPYKTVYESMAPDNPDGYKDGQYIVTPYTGYNVKSYRCKYSKATKEELSRTFETASNYNSRDAVICKIETPSSGTEGGSTGTEGGSTGMEGSGGNITEGPGALPD